MTMFDLVMGNSGWPKSLMDLMYQVQPEQVARYRDHWLEKEGDEEALVLAVYSRIGGGNREEYAEQIEALQANPLYVSDADDDYDNTYATFRFRMTKEQWSARMHELDSGLAEERPSIVWSELWGYAEPLPRNMAIIWEAMISSLPGNFEEKV